MSIKIPTDYTKAADIPQDLKEMADSIEKIQRDFIGTENYDNTSSYDIGDYCIYLDKVYRCITAITTAEEFDVTHWERITIVDNALMKEITSTEAYIFKVSHPVGNYYWSAQNQSPVDLYGNTVGTWVQVKDKFILAAGDEYTAGATGGSTTHNHTQASTTGSTTLTAAQSGLQAHNHGITLYRTDPQYKGLTGGGGAYANGQILLNTNTGYTWTPSTNNNTAKDATQGHTHPLGSTDSASNMPPYEVAYCWKRTA